MKFFCSGFVRAQFIHKNERGVRTVSETVASHLIKAGIRVFVRFSTGKKEVLLCGNTWFSRRKQMDRESGIQIAVHLYSVKSTDGAGKSA